MFKEEFITLSGLQPKTLSQALYLCMFGCTKCSTSFMSGSFNVGATQTSKTRSGWWTSPWTKPSLLASCLWPSIYVQMTGIFVPHDVSLLIIKITADSYAMRVLYQNSFINVCDLYGSTKKIVLSSSFYTWGNWGRVGQWLAQGYVVIQLLKELEFEPKQSGSRDLFLSLF